MQHQQAVSLSFRLQPIDGWPPVAVECLPFTEIEPGRYEALAPPLFVKSLSVGDVIQIVEAEDDQVLKWHHTSKSNRSTVWLLRIGPALEEPILAALRELGCGTCWSAQCGAGSVDVPREVSPATLDLCLDGLEAKHMVAAYPSWRHEDGA